MITDDEEDGTIVDGYGEELSPEQRYICKMMGVSRNEYKRRCVQGVRIPPIKNALPNSRWIRLRFSFEKAEERHLKLILEGFGKRLDLGVYVYREYKSFSDKLRPFSVIPYGELVPYIAREGSQSFWPRIGFKLSTNDGKRWSDHIFRLYRKPK